MEIKIDIQMVVTIISCLAAVSGVAWKISQAVTVFKSGLSHLHNDNKKIRSEIEEIKAVFISHKQELAKLEGMHESSIKALLATVSDMKTTANKLDALWTTVGNIAPDKVNQRTSDKKKVS